MDRYDIDVIWPLNGIADEKDLLDPEGKWVKYSDVEALEKENEELKKGIKWAIVQNAWGIDEIAVSDIYTMFYNLLEKYK